jgi:hypothetical protein
MMTDDDDAFINLSQFLGINFSHSLKVFCYSFVSPFVDEVRFVCSGFIRPRHTGRDVAIHIGY